MNRRAFLKTTGAALGTLAVAGLPALGQGGKLEGEDLANLEKALRDTLGKGFKDLTPSELVKLNMPAIAESGANVPMEVEVNLPPAQVKALHLFADKNPTPRLATVLPMKALPYYASRVRLAETTAVRAVVETQDGKLLLASASTRVTVGGCG
uniref:Thiosulfate oxidation carrier protein SoxY n=1 Tax=Thermus islandicus TaxID=540988 RepID=A0A7C2C302_9DEIN